MAPIKRLILGLCVAVLLACGGKGGGGTTASVTVRAYSAARWVPAQATYAITARTVRDAQQGLRDLIDTFGVAAETTPSDVGRALEDVLLVNPLSGDALASIGIDLDGGFAMFSESFNPTLVVHLTSTADFKAFIDRQTKLRLQSVVIDGSEVFTAALPGGERISWAVADDWLWVHFAFMNDDGETWFKQSRAANGKWNVDLAGVRGVTKPSIIGFADGAKFFADAKQKVPELAQCVNMLQLGSQNIGDLTLAIETDTKRSNVQVALEVGTEVAQGIEKTVIGPPEGWYTATAQVPLAAQWNLDLAAARMKLDPCLKATGIGLAELDEVGIRTARGYVRSFDPDDLKGTGVVAMDLSHKDFFASLLDRIPLRSTLERKRAFGPHAGKSVSIPMFLTVDYVLTDQLALAGVGDGLLAVVVGKGGTVKGPIAEIAVQPMGLTQESWVELLRLVGSSTSEAKAAAAAMQLWRDAKVNLTIDGSRLVLAVSGTRR